MKRAAILFLLLVPLIVFGQTVSYWFQGWQRKPDAQQAQEYFMVPGANMTFTYATNHVILNTVGGAGLFQLTGDVLGGVGVPVPTTLAVIGAGGVNTKITFDTKGRVTGSAAAQLASADFANQGTTTTVLHGNAAGNPSWGSVNLATDVTGTLPGVWITGGNTLGAGTFFLGSIDNRQLQFRVNNAQVGLFSTVPSIALGNVTTASAASSVAIGDNSSATGANSVVVGPNSGSAGAGSVAVGYLSSSSGIASVSIGTGTATGDGSLALVNGTGNALGANSLAIGDQCGTDAGAQFGTSIGSLCQAKGVISFALGYSATANNDGSFVWSDSNAAGYTDTAANQFVAYASGGFKLNSAGAGLHMDGQIYSGNTINSTNSGSVTPYTYYAPTNMGGIAPGQMPMACWGCISAFGAATRVNNGAAVTQNTYYPVTNYIHVVTNHWVANTWTTTNGMLMNVFAGWYRITFAFSGRGGTGDQLEVDVATNNVVTDVIAAHGSSGAGAGKDISMSGTGILYLPAATKVGLRVQDTSASAAITVSHAAITVGTP